MKIVPDKFAKDVIALWDAVENDSEIHIPVVVGKDGGKSKLFVETVREKSKEDKKLCQFRIFINKDDATAYKAKFAENRISIATTNVEALMRYLDKNYSNIDSELECVLSTIDMNGKLYVLDSLWESNKIQN